MGAGFASAEELQILGAKLELRSRGWYLRYTEWPSGHQVVLHRRSDTSVHIVTPWCASEEEAWSVALSMATHRAQEGEAPQAGA
jgi:hypothetical protein